MRLWNLKTENLSLKYNSIQHRRRKRAHGVFLLAKAFLVPSQTAFVEVDLNQTGKFTCNSQNSIHNIKSTNISTNVVYFFPFALPSIRISSLSFPLSLSVFRFSIYVRLFGMLDIHILRSPQIYHNNPSISESEYRSTSTREKKKKR